MGYVRPERAKRPANRPKWPLQSLRRPVCAIRFFEIHDPGAFDEHFFNGLLVFGLLQDGDAKPEVRQSRPSSQTANATASDQHPAIPAHSVLHTPNSTMI
jgi:hypothetical protein